MIKASIDSEWALNLSPVDIWHFNTPSAESIQDETTLEYLGSLAVDLSTPRIATTEVIRNARSVRHIIDLAFGEAAIETSTSLLLKASHDTYGMDHELTHQLVSRNKQASDHGFDEAWFLPMSGVKIFDLADIKATV